MEKEKQEKELHEEGNKSNIETPFVGPSEELRQLYLTTFSGQMDRAVQEKSNYDPDQDYEIHIQYTINNDNNTSNEELSQYSQRRLIIRNSINNNTNNISNQEQIMYDQPPSRMLYKQDNIDNEVHQEERKYDPCQDPYCEIIMRDTRNHDIIILQDGTRRFKQSIEKEQHDPPVFTPNREPYTNEPERMEIICCLVCGNIVDPRLSKLDSKAKCDECDSTFCDRCYIRRCDIGGGQDQDIYFSCPRCRREIIRDKDLLEYFLRRCDLTMETAKQKYCEWAKLGRGKIVIKYEVREKYEHSEYSSW